MLKALKPHEVGISYEAYHIQAYTEATELVNNNGAT
jgi:hypothetical protein